MNNKGFGNNDEQEKARKLSPAEERRLGRFEVTSEELAEQGFRRTDLTVSIMEANKFGLLLLISHFTSRSSASSSSEEDSSTSDTAGACGKASSRLS